MTKLKNGLTMEACEALIHSRNNGHRAVAGSGHCQYQTNGGNRCAVGVFIPDGHPALYSTASAGKLIELHPDLAQHMPLSIEGMESLQRHHDQWVVMARGLRESITEKLKQLARGEGLLETPEENL